MKTFTKGLIVGLASASAACLGAKLAYDHADEIKEMTCHIQHVISEKRAQAAQQTLDNSREQTQRDWDALGINE